MSIPLKAQLRQKQKQKQSQKVIVNIGSSVASKRRAPAQTLQKKAANNQTPTGSCDPGVAEEAA